MACIIMLLSERYRFLSLLVLILCFLLAVQCFPTSVPSFLSKADLKDEIRLANGTVIGNYNYVDREGNPVQVRYYADDSSYGVELKSIKLLDPNNEKTLVNSDKQAKFETFWEPLNPAADFLSDYPNTNYSSNSNKSKFLHSDDLNKESNYKVNNMSPDYEIYLQNELQAPKCGKDKVRIYMDKGKRKIREILNDVATFKYFDQF